MGLAFRDTQVAFRDMGLAFRDMGLAFRDTQVAFRDMGLAFRDMGRSAWRRGGRGRVVLWGAFPRNWQFANLGAILAAMRTFAPVLVALTLLSCGGAQNGNERDWTADALPVDRPLRKTEVLTGTGAPTELHEGKPQPGVVGVRLDLMLAQAPSEARCSCLAVEVGPPTDPRFLWMGSVPRVGNGAMALAIGAQGVSCPGGDPYAARRRPSISAVDRAGEDVFVEIEDLPPGRPLASGAIVPKPGVKGAIYVHPKGPGVIYGRGPGGLRCRVN